MISYDQMLARIFAQCPLEHRQELAQIIARRPFWVADLVAEGLRADGGGRIGGIYNSQTDQIFLDCNLPPGADALGVYLHESVHAGEFSRGARLIQHDTRFCRTLDEVYTHFGLFQTDVGRNYNTRDTPERLRARAPGILALAAFAGIPLALYAKYVGWVDMTGFFVILGAAVIAVFAEKIRQARA